MKIQRIILRTIFIMVLIVISVMTYWLVRPYSVYEFEQPYKVLTPQVNPGDKVVVQQTYCKKLDLPAEITISIADGYHEVLRIIDSRVPPGCFDSASGTAVVPITTPPGLYRIRYVVRVQVNPIREVTYTVSSEQFEVL